MAVITVILFSSCIPVLLLLFLFSYNAKILFISSCSKDSCKPYWNLSWNDVEYNYKHIDRNSYVVYSMHLCYAGRMTARRASQ